MAGFNPARIVGSDPTMDPVRIVAFGPIVFLRIQIGTKLMTRYHSRSGMFYGQHALRRHFAPLIKRRALNPEDFGELRNATDALGGARDRLRKCKLCAHAAMRNS